MYVYAGNTVRYNIVPWPVPSLQIVSLSPVLAVNSPDSKSASKRNYLRGPGSKDRSVIGKQERQVGWQQRDCLKTCLQTTIQLAIKCLVTSGVDTSKEGGETVNLSQ